MQIKLENICTQWTTAFVTAFRYILLFINWEGTSQSFLNIKAVGCEKRFGEMCKLTGADVRWMTRRLFRHGHTRTPARTDLDTHAQLHVLEARFHAGMATVGRCTVNKWQIGMTYSWVLLADWYDILVSYVHLPALEARPHNSLITVITNDPLMETHGCNNNVSISTESTEGKKQPLYRNHFYLSEGKKNKKKGRKDSRRR